MPMEESALLDVPCSPKIATSPPPPSSTILKAERLRKKEHRTFSSIGKGTRTVLTDDTVSSSSSLDVDICATHGLSCIAGACRICGRNTFQILGHLDKSKPRPYSGFCWNGRFSMSKWQMLYTLQGDAESYFVIALEASFFIVAFGRKCKSWISVIFQ